MAYHARFISLPSRSHPFTLAVEEQLCRLKAASRASSLSSSSSITQSLAGLTNLYECVEDLLHMQFSQQVLSPEVNEKGVERLLEGSLRLLDVCGTARDALSDMKQSAQDLQSSLRRTRGGALSNAYDAYKTSTNKINKVISKCLVDLKRMKGKCIFPIIDEKDQDLLNMISLLRDVEAITLAVLESLLHFMLSGSKTGPSKQSSWSLVSKLILSKRVARQGAEEDQPNEVQKVNAALSNTLISHKQHKTEDVKDVQKPLEALETSIQVLEQGLECVFGHLMKTRVSLLNILNQ